MKRSEINRAMLCAKTFMAARSFYLPPWAHWRPEEWRERKNDTGEIVGNMLGWDITDFGSDDFHARGLLLFTLRNGKHPGGKKPYAEKIMVVEEHQETPMHYHWKKMEDIINRGGGNLVLELYRSDDKDGLAAMPVFVSVDGIARCVEPGAKVVLAPGESICLVPGLYHRFYGEPGHGNVLVGEVSSVNDDTSDNRFFASLGRFPAITEDEEPLHLLVSDYSQWL